MSFKRTKTKHGRETLVFGHNEEEQNLKNFKEISVERVKFNRTFRVPDQSFGLNFKWQALMKLFKLYLGVTEIFLVALLRGLVQLNQI